jgi:hypothetical protein
MVGTVCERTRTSQDDGSALEGVGRSDLLS